MTSKAEEIIEHFGTKGMKWGVRNDKKPGEGSSPGETKPTRKEMKKEIKFLRTHSSEKRLNGYHNEAVKMSNDIDLPRINNSPKYKNADFRQDSPLRREYYEEHKMAYQKNLRKVVGDLPNSPSGEIKLSVDFMPKTGDWQLIADLVKHAADRMIIHVEYDEMGHIVGLGAAKPLQQSALTGQDFIEHWGVKGMRWGVRKKPGGAIAIDINSKKPDHSSDGDHAATPMGDGPRAHSLRKKPLHELSNEEIKFVTTRMQLEQNYKNLNPTKIEKGQKLISKFAGMAKSLEEARKIVDPTGKRTEARVAAVGKKIAEKSAAKAAAKTIGKKGVKKAAKAAVKKGWGVP